MKTEELIKETAAEVTAATDNAGKATHGLLEIIRDREQQIEQLQVANLELRAQILEFRNFINGKLGSVSKVPESIPVDQHAMKRAVIGQDRSADKYYPGDR